MLLSDITLQYLTSRLSDDSEGSEYSVGLPMARLQNVHFATFLVS